MPYTNNLVLHIISCIYSFTGSKIYWAFTFLTRAKFILFFQHYNLDFSVFCRLFLCYCANLFQQESQNLYQLKLTSLFLHKNIQLLRIVYVIEPFLYFTSLLLEALINYIIQLYFEQAKAETKNYN